MIKKFIRKGCAVFLCPYFEGWYLKHQWNGKTIAFIPALHRDKDGEWEGSVQVILDSGAWYFTYPSKSCRISRNPLRIKIGDNLFTEKGVCLNIQEEDFCMRGKLTYGKLHPLCSDIMGIFGMIPLLQCKHGVISMFHSVRGRLIYNGEKLNLNGGNGYIETDRGRSFPGYYLWTQCFFGAEKKNSIMLSAADIPMPFFHFPGCICAVCYRGREYRLATYLGGRVDAYGHGTVQIRQGAMRIRVTRMADASHDLRAPQNGKMDRIIRESPSCKVRYEFWIAGSKVFDFVSEQASFEQA